MTSRQSSQPVLQARGIQITYPNGTRALTSTDLRINAGEFLVLLGPSGAGKSSLLRSLNGLVPLSAGTIESAEARPIAGPPGWRLHRKRTAMVFQQHQLIGRLSVLSNVLTGRLGFHNALRTLLPLPRPDKLIALRALDRVGLLGEALKRVDQLSGGQQQRVGIARAIAQEPRLLLADEPVASLDPATSARVLALIHGICKADGIAAVVSLHQVELARQFADRVVGIAAGRVVFDGAPADLERPLLERIYGRAEPHARRATHAPHTAPAVAAAAAL